MYRAMWCKLAFVKMYLRKDGTQVLFSIVLFRGYAQTERPVAVTAEDYARAEKFLILELGEITCEKQTKWLYPRLKKIAHLIAYAIAKELGHKVEKPHL